MIIQKNIFSFSSYVLFGIAGFAIELGILHGLMQLPISYLIAVPISATLGVTIHFILVHAKSFDHKNTIGKTFPRFIIITALNIATGTLFVYSLVTFLSVEVIPARITSAIILGIIAYLIHKYFTFT